jgi:formate dehydrogenase major subunit
VRALFEAAWGVTLESEPGLRIPNMFDAALDGSFKGLYVPGRGHRAVRPRTPSTSRRRCGDGMRRRAGPVPERDREVRPRLPAGASFLEKDGTFTNAERRISRVRKVMPPLAGKADWEVTVRCQGAGLPDALRPPVRDHGRDRAR